MHKLLLGVPNSWSYKPIPFQEKKLLLTEHRVKLCPSLVQRSGISLAQRLRQLQLQLLSLTLWKKKFLVNCMSEKIFLIFFFKFLEFMHSFILTVDWFFTEFPCIHIAWGTLIEITIWIFFRSSLPSSI